MDDGLDVAGNRPGSPGAYLPVSAGSLKVPGSCPEASRNCLEAPRSCPKTRGRCPKSPDSCPKSPDSCLKSSDSCPKAPGRCPEAPDRCPEASSDCPKAPDRCPEASSDYPNTNSDNDLRSLRWFRRGIGAAADLAAEPGRLFAQFGGLAEHPNHRVELRGRVAVAAFARTREPRTLASAATGKFSPVARRSSGDCESWLAQSARLLQAWHTVD